MSSQTVFKTVRQYNKKPISNDDMKKLREIAADYSKVKNYVYMRYGSISSLSKLYPGYTIQNELTKSGMRESLGMPSVYFHLAVFDALGDIKSQWTRTKSKILAHVNCHTGFNEEEKHYLRFLLKVSNVFEAVLNHAEFRLPADIQRQHDELAEQVNIETLHRYMRRQVRKYHVKLHTEHVCGFSIAERAYRYADHGIYISVKEKRKRIFVLLTDNNQYKSQLYISLFPEENRIEIKVPIYTAVRRHKDYTNKIGISIGMYTMLTTDSGNQYGTALGKYQTRYSDWVRTQTTSYCRNKKDNPGRKKYNAQKRRFEEQLHSYINCELNRFLQTEKPDTIYLAKLPRPRTTGYNRKINHSIIMWQRGYMKSRLMQKCRQHSIKLVDVIGKDISYECSRCGGTGYKARYQFVCTSCGSVIDEKTNTARNTLKRGREGKVLH